MPRILRPEQHAAKRNDIVQTARHLVESKGYEQVSIQDVLDELGISKGAFYHYFDSKPALLEAIVLSMADEVRDLLEPITRETNGDAVFRLQQFVSALVTWKASQRGLLLALMKVWYSDDNALLRHKMRQAVTSIAAPKMAGIIRQGIHEGVFTVSCPDETAELLLCLLQHSAEAVGRLALSSCVAKMRVENTVTAYTEAIQRALGMPKGSFVLVDRRSLYRWFSSGDQSY
jgi:AcrR family transcriptional regulator